MAMKQCPKCGEQYSDTYKECPFCQEEEELESGVFRRSGRRTVKRSRQFSLITPTLIVLIVLMSALLVYLLYGDQLAKKFDSENIPGKPALEDQLPPENDLQKPEDEKQPEDEKEPEDEKMPEDEQEPEDEKKPEENNQVEMPEGPVTPTKKPDSTKPDPAKPDSTKPDSAKPNPAKPEPAKPRPASGGYEKANALPDGLKLSKTDFTVKNAGESYALTVSGGSGNYQWYSEDPKVASVDSQGNVKVLSRGTVHIVATDGTKKGVCIVRSTVPEGEGIQQSKPTNAKLNKEDYTTHVGDPDVQLKVSGATGAVKWSVTDSSVATVSADGLVKAVGKGTATVTASFDGSSLSCIVRVS